MSAISFGTSCSPLTVNTTAEPVPFEDANEKEADPNKILQCPYDKNHQIRASRFPFHILKCRKNHLKVAHELKTCPFDAKHLVPKREFAHHVANCVYLRPAEQAQAAANPEMPLKFQAPANTWTNPTSEEDWDKGLSPAPRII